MIEIRPADERAHTRIDWLDSWHSFSFGQHYDPSNVGHGLLLVSNDDRVAAGGGFGTHGHQDMEIVTWVLSGTLAHRDSTGTDGVITPGLAQRMSAGTGIRHSEMNASTTEPVHFVQMWVPPDTAGVEPGYEQCDVSADLDTGGLVAIASGSGEAALHIHQRDATLWAARTPPGADIAVPEAAHVHVFVAEGGATLRAADGTAHELVVGDAARLTDEAGPALTAGSDGMHILVWATA
ncbi:MAG TPA: pirin family protein [Microthrixaceae bacterium]|nr:pirin family protein [Microthrixaceae bacterium]